MGLMQHRSARQKILLTGGSGLVGSRIAAILRDRCQVTHYDLSDPADGLPWIEGDLCDVDAVEAACLGKDIVIHVAALHGQAWNEAGDHAGFQVNMMGTHNILEGARKGGVWRVIYTSSIWATGHAPVPAPYLPIDEDLPREPMELYGLTKKLGEQMCLFVTQRYGLSTICLRPGGICPENVPLQRHFDHLFGCVDVRDVAMAHVLALDAPEGIRHGTFVITADSPLCTIDATHFFADRVGVLESLYPGIERLIREGTIEIRDRAEWYSSEKAKRLLRYAPRHTFEMPRS